MSDCRKNIVIDIGNSYTKIAAYQNNILTDFNLFEVINLETIKSFCKHYGEEFSCIVSYVKDYPKSVAKYLNDRYHVVDFDSETPLPIKIQYSSPETLGLDRRAIAVGAAHRFPGNNLLNIDSGTALKYDFITSEGVYVGGAISPGIMMRYKSLHYFTDKLPFVEYIGNTELIGNSTYKSITSGVLNGILHEVEGTIKSYQQMYNDVKIILSGGDYRFFDNNLNFKTFTAPNIILEGLNIILNYNLEIK